MKNLGKSFLIIIILVTTITTIVSLSACSKNTLPPTEPNTDKSDDDQNNKGNNMTQVTDPIELPPEPDNIVNEDINGDGQNDIIEVFFKKYISRAQDGEELKFKLPYIRAKVNGVSYENFFGDIVTFETKINTFNFGIDKKKAIAVAFDVGGTGAGSELLYVFNDELKFLPLPKHYDDKPEEENGSFGFKSRIAYIDDYKVRVVCDETGFTEDIPLDRELYENYAKNDLGVIPRIYDDNGKLIGEVIYMDTWVDSIYDVKIVNENGRQYVEFAQYIWGFSHGNSIGSLISTLTWEDGTYKVVRQKCIPWFENW